MRLPLPRARSAAWLLAALALVVAPSGCADPPQKELDQAEAAIEVAVSAGAERLAPTTLTAARTALTQARDAVSQHDYKSALSHALDSRERAQAAAREAGEARAKVRTDAEGDLRELTALLARLQKSVGAPPAGVARARVRRARLAAGRLAASLQKARAAVDAQDYATARNTMTGLRTDLERALADVGIRPDAQTPPQDR